MIAVRRFEVRGSVEEVLAALSHVVSRQPWFRRANTPFVGVISGSRFRISRVVRGTDSWNPVLYGRVTQAASAASLRVLITLHPLVWALQAGISIAIAAASLTRSTASPLVVLLACALPWIPAAVFFPRGVSLAMRELERCLDPAHGRRSQ